MSAQTQANTLKQLNQSILAAKTKAEQLSAKINLIDYYSQVNPRKWRETNLALQSERNKYPGKQAQNRLNLIYAEYLFKNGNTDLFKEIYVQKLQGAVFPLWEDTYRYQRIQFEFELLKRNFNRARTTADSTLRLTQRKRNNAFTSIIYQDISRLYMNKSMKDSANWAATRAISFAKRSNKREILVLALQNEANNFGYFLDLEGAVQKELQAIRLSEELHIEFHKIHSFIEIARYSITVGNWTEGLGYLKRALQLARDHQDDPSIALISLLMSKVYLHQNQISLSIFHVNRAKEFYTTEKDLYHLAQCAYASGHIAAMQGEIEKAIDSYKTAQIYFEKEKMTSELAEVYQGFGELYLKSGDVNKAKAYLELSIESHDEVQSISLIDRYKMLAQLSMSSGDLQNALKYQNAYILLLESNSIKRNDSKIAELTSSNLREERERLIELQQRSIEKEKKEQEILKLQSDRQLYIAVIFIFAVIFGLVILTLRMKQVRSRQEQREAELSQTLLRAQMNPHFVFNAMSVIQSYIYENNPEKSSQFLVNFSRLMRLILENSPKEFIPIELEMEILDKYLSTQKMRFENRFSYQLNVSEDLLANKAIVPPMITQPFIENAIEHGQLHTVKDGQIEVQMNERDGKLEITIADNGIGRKKSAQTKKIQTHRSMAIDITKERIDILNKKYKFNGSLTFNDLDSKKGTGTKVTILLPLKFDSTNF
ncbi:MAG: hypothetical protein RJB36_306 [Bacteroidota bacterium]